MAPKINPSKLLPQSKSSSLAKTERSSSLVVKEKKVNIASSIKPIELKHPELFKKTDGIQKTDFGEVHGKLIKVEKFLKSDFLLSKKESEKKRKKKEKEDFDKAEKKLETKESNKFKLPGISGPSLGFLDRLKRFLFFTALGWLVPKILEFLPKLEGFANLIGGVYKFAEGLFGGLFNGFMSLVKFGGDLKDKTLGFIAQAKAGVGGDYDKEFKKLENQFNTFVNASIIAGALSVDIGLTAVDEINKNKNRGGGGGSSYKAGYAAGYAAGLASRGGRPRRPGEAAAGGTLAENVARQRLTRERMTAPTGPKGPLDRVRRGFRGAAAQLQTGTLFSRGAGVQKAIYNAPGKIKNLPKKIPAFWNKIFKGPFAKLKGPLSRFAGVAVPGLGAAVGAADAAARFKAGDKIGGTLASVSAALDAATVATALTGIGLPVAGILGGISMGIDVVLLIRDILSVIPFIPKNLLGFYRGGRIVRKYQSGGTAGARKLNTPVRRSISKTRRRPLIIQPPKTKPGKDVGGEDKIKEFYSKDSVDSIERPSGGWLSLFNAYTGKFEKKDKDSTRPYDALTKTSEILKEIPIVGGLMGASVDIALGQKPDKRIYQSLSAGIGYLIESLANQKTNQSVTSLMGDLRGFAEGGYVTPSRELKETYNPLSSGDLISKVLGPTIDQRVNEAIQSIQKELQKVQQKKEDAKEPPQDLDMTPGNIKVTSDSPDFWLLVTASLFENGKSADNYQGAADVAQAIYNRVSLPGWPKSIREVILEPGQFQPVRQYGGYSEWSKIKTKEDAMAFSKKYKGYSGNIVEKIAASLLNTSNQQKAKDFVGPRDNFRSVSYEKSADHLDNSTEVNRYGHVFGFEPRGANISKFKKGQLSAADVNRNVVQGTVVQEPSTTPTKGAIGVILPKGNPQFSSGFKWRWGRQHRGHDYGVDANSPVLSSQDGKVVDILENFGGHGDAIVVEHSDGSRNIYGHVIRLVSKGSSVKKGQTIAQVKYWPNGNGYQDNTHLHFERIENGKHVDPSSYVSSLQPPKQQARKPGQPSQASNSNIINASGLALSNLPERIKNLKPGQKIIFNNVGSIQSGKNWLGQPEVKFYDTKGGNVGRDKFEELLRNSEVEKQMKSNNLKVQNMQSGGIVPSKPNLPIPNSFASYESYGSGTSIAIQPVLIRQQTPIRSSRSNEIISFPFIMSSGVNNIDEMYNTSRGY